MMFIRVLAIVILALVAGAGLLVLSTQNFEFKNSRTKTLNAETLATIPEVKKEVRPSENISIEKQFGSMVFEKIAEDPNMVLEIEKSSVRSIIDTSGSVLAAGITRIVMKHPVTQDVFFVNAVIAVCGYNSLMIVRSKSFDKNGVVTDELKETQVLTGVAPDSVAGISYKFLCGKAAEGLGESKKEERIDPVPMPPIPSYDSDRSYKTGWI